ncbi:MAG: esterase [Sphingomonas sp. SCN 67-18]|uniref:RBBP9/YdeN family alpha/beta hydrolase n=1 Tax=uncultured Sphingomonas sp. TaxID=158754 RepID=UPI00086D644C|nr:alpha/beta fold hydrolase [Sphingomonas sp. SCN 67-18]ODU21872.1 MAG: esterase [Sphingomonas sp. SCN 67-18]
MVHDIHENDRHHPLVLTVPGLNGSGPSHWQSLWESARPDTVRVELGMWSQPHRNAWITKIDQAIRGLDRPVILVAHSLGCLAVAWWAELSGQPYGWPVAGALLVAPADVDRADARDELKRFGPSPTTPLPFPSIVVASDDDPWISPDRARSLAASWGSHFESAGPIGHINAASGIGWWQEGQQLLERVIRASGRLSGGVESLRDVRAILAVSGTDAAHAHYLR